MTTPRGHPVHCSPEPLYEGVKVERLRLAARLYHRETGANPGRTSWIIPRMAWAVLQEATVRPWQRQLLNFEAEVWLEVWPAPPLPCAHHARGRPARSRAQPR